MTASSSAASCSAPAARARRCARHPAAKRPSSLLAVLAVSPSSSDLAKLWVNFLLAPNSEKSDLQDSSSSSQSSGPAQSRRRGSGDSGPAGGSGLRRKKWGSGLGSREPEASLNVALEKARVSLPSVVEAQDTRELLRAEPPSPRRAQVSCSSSHDLENR